MRLTAISIRRQIVARWLAASGVAPRAGTGIMTSMNPAWLTELFSEVVILVLGLLLAVMAIAGRYNLPQGLTLWLVLGVALLIWGGRAWMRSARYARPSARVMQWVRGGSLVLAGALMIAMPWMPFERTSFLLASVGAILAVRGAIGAALAGRRAMTR